jgi:teichuronic acid biosynthesis glycosyltransferase TuaH
MKKMLYIMGIEWNWIFQRPQVLALELEKEYDLTVVGTKQPVHAKHQNNRLPKRLLELYQIPFQEKNRLIGAVARHIHTGVLGNLREYDVIWVGYPLFGRYIPEDYRGTVVYDCMDNFEALYQDRREKNLRRACAEEYRLLERADLVFASSLKLKEKLLAMCPGKAVTVVRNGYSNISLVKPTMPQRKEQYALGYIGTLSAWFDSELVLNSLEEQEDISYELIGPVADHQSLAHDRVHYRGVVEHGRLGEVVQELDCLLMPFQINDIILYVDPVKLYEYIAWGKCIVSCWYPEIDRFGEFVYFYHDKREYTELLRQLAQEGFPPKFTQDRQEKFLAENSWQARAQTIRECLEAADEAQTGGK